MYIEIHLYTLIYLPHTLKYPQNTSMSFIYIGIYYKYIQIYSNAFQHIENTLMSFKIHCNIMYVPLK
jgi:hypothetical protein